MTDIEKLLTNAPKLLEILEAEYRYTVAQNFANCPTKLCFPLKGTKDEAHVYINSMVATLSTGESCSKTIWVDEDNSQVKQILSLFDTDGQPIHHWMDPEFTFFRCGLAVALCMKFFFGESWKDKTVGFIGFGKINQMTSRILTAASGKRRLEGFITLDSQGHLDFLKTCDTIVVCTNNFDLEKRYKAEQFKQAKLLISQDGEWTLNCKAFNCWVVADHPQQLMSHQKAEKISKYTSYPLTELEYNGTQPNVSVAYLHGLAISDAVVAQFLAQNL